MTGENRNASPRIGVVSRRRAALMYLGFNYGALLLFLVQGVVLVPFYLRYLDARIYGAWLATGNVISYFGVLDFGLTTVLLQRVASLSGPGDQVGLLRVVGTGVTTLSLLSSLPLILGLLLARAIARLVGLRGNDAFEVVQAFHWAAFGSALMMLALTVHSVLLGLQRQLVTGIVGLAANLLGIWVTVMSFIHGYGIRSLPFGLVARALFSSIGFAIYLAWLLAREFGAWPRWSRDEFRLLWRQSLWTFTANFSNSQCDNLVVGAVNDPSEVTVLNMTRKMGEFVATVARQLPSSLMPGISHLGGSGDSRRVREVTMTLLRAAVFLGLVGMGTMLILNRSFVQLWVGQQLFGGQGVTLLVALVGLLGIVTATLSSTIYGLGAIRPSSRITILEGLCKATLAIILCRSVSYWGVLVASLVSMGIVSLPLQFRCYARTTATRPMALLRELGGPLVKGVVVIAGVYWLASFLPEVGGYKMLALEGVLSMCAMMLLLLCLDHGVRSCATELLTGQIARTSTVRE